MNNSRKNITACKCCLALFLCGTLTACGQETGNSGGSSITTVPPGTASGATYQPAPDLDLPSAQDQAEIWSPGSPEEEGKEGNMPESPLEEGEEGTFSQQWTQFLLSLEQGNKEVSWANSPESQSLALENMSRLLLELEKTVPEQELGADFLETYQKFLAEAVILGELYSKVSTAVLQGLSETELLSLTNQAVSQTDLFYKSAMLVVEALPQA